MKHRLIILFALVSTIAWAGDCPDQVKITAPAGVGGQVTRTPIGDCKTTYTLEAVPLSGYEFIGWADDASITSATREVTISTTSDTQYRAIFGKYTDLHPTGGTITVGVSDISTLTYSMTATPTVACDTINWSNGFHNATILYTEGDGTRTVSFTKEDKLAYQVADASPVGGTIVATAEECGFTLKAQPAAGYGFVKWQDNNSTDSERHVGNIKHSSYTAIFGYGTAMKGDVVYATVQEAIDESTDLPIMLIQDANENLSIAKTVTINGNNHTIGDITITNTGDLTLSSALTANNLYLTAQQGASSQLHNAGNLTYTDAYVDIRLEPVKSVADPDKYYAFGVPFEVEVPAAKEASTTITRQSEPSVPTTNVPDYIVWEYDGAMRAENKENGWQTIAAGTLVPGKFYMFGLNDTENVWRFKKKANTALGGGTNLTVGKYDSDCANKGWNALANSQLYYAQAAIDGIDYAQTYDNASASGKYDVAPFEDVAYVMGGTFFIQASDNGILTLSAKEDQPYLRAPMRAEDNSKVRCRVELTNATQHDVLYLTACDEATADYQVGKDVIKMLGRGTDSYIWANDYGYTLCANDKPWVDSVAEFSITMYASQAGEFTLSAPMGELLYNGAYQANLALGDYMLNLNKGNNKGYTIRLGEPKNTPTGLGKSEYVRGKNVKFIYNNTLYIRQNGRIYNAQGGEVR